MAIPSLLSYLALTVSPFPLAEALRKSINLTNHLLQIGAFWLSLAATLQPSYNAVGAYTNGASNPAVGEAEFLASFGEDLSCPNVPSC